MTRLLLPLVLAAAGCGGPVAPAVHPVSGRLAVGEFPAADARIAFRPLAEGQPVAVAVTGLEDGSFRLTTRSPNDGAAAGEYVVTILWPNSAVPIDECADPAAQDRLFGYYADRGDSPMRATVRPGPNDLLLAATVGSGSWSLPRRREISERP
ncbi:MAG TPA: hypothetical protein VM597_19045 [Gemmataceae bacterium]|jgi:hypothetical protein|nr:hypothetical protein [Gemmataceae bacterium]